MSDVTLCDLISTYSSLQLRGRGGRARFATSGFLHGLLVLAVQSMWSSDIDRVDVSFS